MSDAITEIVSVDIDATTKTPTQQSFSRGAVVAYHAHNSDSYRIYEDLAGMVADSFTTTEPAYLMAQAYWSQSPAPKDLMVIRIPTATARTFTLLMTDATAGNISTLKLKGKDGVEHELSRTIPSSSSTSAEATAWDGLIDTALGSLGAAGASTATVTVTPANTGEKIYAYGINPNTMTYADTAATVGYGTILDNQMNANPDFYGLAIQDSDTTNVEAVAAWAESHPVAFFPVLSNTVEILGSSVCGAALEGFAYDRTIPIFSDEPQDYAGAAAIGKMLPYNPGSATLKFKTLKGVQASNLSPTHRSDLNANHVNHYTTVADINIVREGYASSGQFFDVLIGTDWLSARMKEAVFGALANAPKIPYEDTGIAVISGLMGAVLDQGVRQQFLAKGTTLVIPQTVAAALDADKAARRLTGMKFTARMAGAIHNVEISGTLTV